ncbi:MULTISPECIES: hypothetical protein [Enterocloster]|uniref:hypothetical protein n=1 Tax=Enterocloster bolteae TaxID=208479 RepID=UPI0028FE48A0|nr:hypothetical protein [Enterocloster clostridioformis]MDU1961675.1 hypothetical protein [Enterocloster clostridioformis]
MLKKANIQWSGKTLRNQIEKGQVSFDCAVQRNPVWDVSRKSLLIHSMLYRFFDSNQTSVSEIYNKSVGSGSAKPDKVQSRVQVLDSLIGG